MVAVQLPSDQIVITFNYLCNEKIWKGREENVIYCLFCYRTHVYPPNSALKNYIVCLVIIDWECLMIQVA